MKKTLFRMISSIIVVLLFVLCGGQSASAGSKEGVEACERGDYPTVFKEFRLLAEQGDAYAQYNLGWLYERGVGIPKDYKSAVKWYRRSANQGNATAQYLLGGMYHNGEDVSQDYVLAHKWWNIAGANAHKRAIKNRDIVAKRMTPSQVEKAQSLARELKPKKSK